MLDGDNVRYGLCSDLGFNNEDRKENIRRIGEISKLMLESGVIVLTAFTFPFMKIENRCVHSPMVSSLKVCKSRNPKGIYQKAISGEISHFTGISSPYEISEKLEVTINIDKQSLDASVEQIVEYVISRGIIANGSNSRELKS